MPLRLTPAYKDKEEFHTIIPSANHETIVSVGDSVGKPEVFKVKAGGMRVSKKQENRPAEKNAKPPGKEKTSAIAGFSTTQNMDVLLAETLSKMSHKIHAAALQVAHQKPQPALEKFILPKRIHIIQQPWKC